MKIFVKIFLLTCIGVFNLLYSQSFSQRFFFNYPKLFIYGARLMPSSELYFIGYAEDTTCVSYYNPVLGKCDLLGNIVEVNNYCMPTQSQQTFANTLVHHTNGNILFHTLFDKSLIHICDSTGSNINTIAFIDTTLLSYSIFDIIEHQTDIYVLGGESYYPIFPDTTSSDYGLFIVKLDLMGNFIWRRRYDELQVTEIPSIIRSLPDGRLIVGANKSNMLQRGPEEVELSHTYIFTLDTAGNQLETWIDPDPNTYRPTEFIYTADDHLIYTGGYKKDQYWYDIYQTGYICKLNWINKVKNWEIFKGDSIPFGDNFTGYNDIDLYNNTLIASGSFYLEDSITIYGGITKIDLNGNIIWHRLYRGLYLSEGNDNYFYESAILDDGSIMACGRSNDLGGFSGDPVRYQGWIVKVDSNGLGIPNFSLSLPEEPTIEMLDISVYPNPATNSIYIRPTGNMTEENFNIEITNMNGQVILYQVVSLTQGMAKSIDVSNISNGTYILSIKNDGGYFRRKIFIKNN